MKAFVLEYRLMGCQIVPLFINFTDNDILLAKPRRELRRQEAKPLPGNEMRGAVGHLHTERGKDSVFLPSLHVCACACVSMISYWRH